LYIAYTTVFYNLKQSECVVLPLVVTLTATNSTAKAGGGNGCKASLSIRVYPKEAVTVAVLYRLVGLQRLPEEMEFMPVSEM
jgi:hypothetical protein